MWFDHWSRTNNSKCFAWPNTTWKVLLFENPDPILVHTLLKVNLCPALISPSSSITVKSTGVLICCSWNYYNEFVKYSYPNIRYSILNMLITIQWNYIYTASKSLHTPISVYAIKHAWYSSLGWGKGSVNIFVNWGRF